MIRDKLNILSDRQAETTVATHASTNVLDFTAAKRGGRGNPVRIRIRVRDAVTSDGSATVQFKIQTCAAEGFGSGVVDLYDSGAIAKASLTAGTIIFDGYIPANVLRYLRTAYIIGTAAITAGTFDAFLALAVDDHPMV